MKKIVFMLFAGAMLLGACSDDAPAGISPEIRGGSVLTAGVAAVGESGAADENGEEPDIGDELEEDAEIKELTYIGYFIIETPAGERPVMNDDGTLTLPGGGVITTTENDSRVGLESGAVLEYDESARPYRLAVDAQFKLLGGEHSIRIETPGGFVITIDELAELYHVPARQRRIPPWVASMNEADNPVFEIGAVTFTALDSVFPMFRDEYNGVILFKQSRIELGDGTVIDAPLNTRAQIDGGELSIIIGAGDAVVTSPDGAVRRLPEGTVLDGGLSVVTSAETSVMLVGGTAYAVQEQANYAVQEQPAQPAVPAPEQGMAIRVGDISIAEIFSLTVNRMRYAFGEPSSSGLFQGSYFYTYEDRGSFFFRHDYTDTCTLLSLWVNPQNITIGGHIPYMNRSELVATLGMPYREGLSYESEWHWGDYYMDYRVGGFMISFDLPSPEQRATNVIVSIRG